MDVNLGDATLRINLVIPGVQRHRIRIHLSPPRDTSASDRVVQGPPYYHPHSQQEAGIEMDLKADQGVDASVKWFDETGQNEVPMPDGASRSRVMFCSRWWPATRSAWRSRSVSRAR